MLEKWKNMLDYYPRSDIDKRTIRLALLIARKDMNSNDFSLWVDEWLVDYSPYFAGKKHDELIFHGGMCDSYYISPSFATKKECVDRIVLSALDAGRTQYGYNDDKDGSYATTRSCLERVIRWHKRYKQILNTECRD